MVLKHTKRLSRAIMASILWRTGITRPSFRARKRLSIATFHRVLPAHLVRDYPFPGLCVTPQDLDWVLGYFGRHYSCGTLEDCVRRHENSEGGHRPLLAITFDDAQLDNYVHARPILSKHDVKATFFAPASNIESGIPLWHDRLAYAVLRAIQSNRSGTLEVLSEGPAHGVTNREIARTIVSEAKNCTPERRDSLLTRLATIADMDPEILTSVPEWAGMMSWNDLESLHEEGHEIGSHSLTHSILTHVSDDQLQQEFEESKRMIEDHIDRPVASFCYPNGDFDDRCLQLLQEHDYRQACSTRWGSNETLKDRYALRRFDIVSSHMRRISGGPSRGILAWRMSGLYPGLSS